MNTTIKVLLVGMLLSGWLPGMISAAQAATVSFMDIRATDGNDATGFDVSATEQTGDTTLTLGILPFSISASGITALMSDTLLMKVVAQPGWRITSLTYTESGEWRAQNGFAAATIQMLANQQGPPAGGTVGFNSDGAWGPIQQNLLFGTTLTEVDVSISNQLFAGGVAQIWKTAGKLEVGLEAIEAVPVPAAVWLFGSALVGFLAFSRRRLS